MTILRQFEPFQVGAWLEDGMAIPVDATVQTRKRPDKTPWYVGVAATLAIAVSNAFTLHATASAEARPELSGRIAETRPVGIDPDVIVGPPVEFWARAMASLQQLRPAQVFDSDDPPIHI